MESYANWSDFLTLDIRTGTIIKAQLFEKAIKPAYQLEIDFGILGIKKSSAQITDQYSSEELIGMQIIAIVNFPVKQIANFFSECLALGAMQGNKITLLTTERIVPDGLKIG